MKFRESDLYGPIKNYFTKLGYNVYSEVKDCDVVAVKEDEMYIIELKKGFNLKLIYQAMSRQRAGVEVYVAIPRPKRTSGKEYFNMLKLLEALGVGLITVALESPVLPVDVLLFPKPPEGAKNSKLKNRIVNEFRGRSGDYNIGGKNNVKINTAYRERCIKIACLLEKYGALSAKKLVNDFNCEKNTHSILHMNSYGWFERESRGVYFLTEAGKASLSRGEFLELVEYYRKMAREMEPKGEDKNEL